MAPKLAGRFVALILSPVLAAAALALVVWGARAAPASPSYFVTAGGAGSCAQSSPCQLQTALGLAGTGNTVYVAKGTYHGAGAAVITLTHSIKLQGGWSGNPSGPPIIDLAANPTTLDGQGSRRGVYVSSGLTPTIDGFIVTRGNATGLFAGCLGDSAKGCGGGMFVDHAAAAIEDDTFVNNTALVTATVYGQGLGGGLYLESASGSVITHNVFLSNTGAVAGFLTMQGNGGGLTIDGNNTNTVVVENNQFIGNVGAQWGGGMALEFTHGVQVQGNLFQNNSAFSGGGLYTWYCNAEVMGNTFRGNTGDGAAYLGYFTGPFAGNLLVDNPAGSGILVTDGTGGVLAIVYNNIVGHSGVGLDAYAYPGGPLNLIALHNTLVGSGAGTGLLVEGSHVTVTANNNLLSGFATGIMSLHPASVTVDANYTLFDLDVGAPGNALFTHNVFGPAAFVDPATRNYHIQFISAARDAGASSFVTTDFDGDPRPLGAAPDIGADETRFVTAEFWPLILR